MPGNSGINELGWEELAKAAKNEIVELLEENQDNSSVLRVHQRTKGCSLATWRSGVAYRELIG